MLQQIPSELRDVNAKTVQKFGPLYVVPVVFGNEGVYRVLHTFHETFVILVLFVDTVGLPYKGKPTVRKEVEREEKSEIERIYVYQKK